MLGREQRRDPAVGDLARERGVLGADRGEVDRDALLDGGDRELERLAGPVGQRQLEGLAVELDALAGERHAHHGDVLARALQLLGEALPVPALGDLRPRGADAEDHAPARELVDRGGRHRGHRRRAGGHLEDPRAEADPRGLTRQPAEHGRGVRAVGLGGPHRVIAQPLGLLDDVQLVLRAEAEAPVADVHAELHRRHPYRASPGRMNIISGTTHAGETFSRKRTASAMSGRADHLLGGDLLLDEVGHRGVDERGAQRGGLDALRAELLVHRFRPADDAVLGGGVDRQPGLSALAGDRGGVDDERVAVLAGRSWSIERHSR